MDVRLTTKMGATVFIFVSSLKNGIIYSLILHFLCDPLEYTLNATNAERVVNLLTIIFWSLWIQRSVNVQVSPIKNKNVKKFKNTTQVNYLWQAEIIDLPMEGKLSRF